MIRMVEERKAERKRKAEEKENKEEMKEEIKKINVSSMFSIYLFTCSSNA